MRGITPQNSIGIQIGGRGVLPAVLPQACCRSASGRSVRPGVLFRDLACRGNG